MFTYSVKIEPQEEGGFFVSVPSLPGCFSEGDTLDESMKNIEDAIEGYLHVLWKNREDIPMESSWGNVSVDSSRFAYA